MLSSAILKNKGKLLGLLLVISCVYLAWRLHKPAEEQSLLLLYGNIDLRQVSLAFNNSERIVEVLAQEGDQVKTGQALARLDTSRLTPRVAEALAQAAAQKQAVTRLHNGSRPEEIDEARANLNAAKADAGYARSQYDRLRTLFADTSGKAVSQQDLDNSRAIMTSAEAHVLLNKKSLELALIGPRQEDIRQAEAQLDAFTAQLAYLRQQIKDAELLAPVNAVVRSRLLEPGEMSSPQRPVFSLALLDPKWVRAYVSEVDLGHLHPGMAAEVRVDSYPGNTYQGWIGFISPVAEFTPKSVQTEELRPSLSYEVRIFVKDGNDDLRLGMPATVSVQLSLANRKAEP
jgi:HlyD family secretion protein